MRTRGSPSSADSAHARITREAEAFDDGRAVELNLRWKARVPHVMNGPNSRFGKQRFRHLVEERIVGARAMDVGCGCGELSAELHSMGASGVYAFDVSRRQLEQARAQFGNLSGVTFHLHNAESPIPGRFDLIVGNAILHHIDFRKVLVTLFERNLAPGGRMVFIEPMSHPLTLGFHLLFPSSHTADEWPITHRDVNWLRNRFDAQVIPINLISFPTGIVSSLMLRSEDNWLMRLADRIDRKLERRKGLGAYGRDGIIVIEHRADG
jgi:2-polyprenyl-3-methyl-5-hydroxy-6-metoxy-1,4-benzoquinol methylase